MNSKKEKSLLVINENREEFNKIVYDIINNPNVSALKEHLQHKNTYRFEHCQSVAFLTYLICKKLKLDYISAARRSNVT